MQESRQSGCCWTGPLWTVGSSLTGNRDGVLGQGGDVGQRSHSSNGGRSRPGGHSSRTSECHHARAEGTSVP